MGRCKSSMFSLMVSNSAGHLYCKAATKRGNSSLQWHSVQLSFLHFFRCIAAALCDFKWWKFVYISSMAGVILPLWVLNDRQADLHCH